jgi:DNA gyrase subunit A
MTLKRPDLTRVDPEILRYIENLEKEIDTLTNQSREHKPPETEILPQFIEAPSPVNLFTFSAQGYAKRTPRHFYYRQRRGGMGIFDIDLPDGDSPKVIFSADPKITLLIFTNLARAFRLPANYIPESPIRSKGISISTKILLQPDERIVTVTPDQATGTILFVSHQGYIRQLRHHVFGEYMRPGTSVFDTQTHGQLVDATWSTGSRDALITTLNGKAIRFSEKLIPPQGCQGIRLDGNDEVVSVTSVTDEDNVFLVDADGKGTIRVMRSFLANKSPGGIGKIAMNTNLLVSATSTDDSTNDIFLISRLSKIIRFSADEIPVKERAVQGVNCMQLRSDLVVALTIIRNI